MYNVGREMIVLRALVICIFMCHVSAQINIPKIYNWFNRNSGGNIPVKTGIINDIPGSNIMHAGSYIPVIPKECKNIGICEDIPNYPEEYVKALVQEPSFSRRFKFNGNVLKTAMIPQDKLGLQQNYQELCGYEKKYITPRAAKNLKNQWQYIVNVKSGPGQSFYVDVCTNLRGPCSNAVTFAMYYQGYCEQKFILVNMVAINKNGVLVEEPHQIPSCCSCVYTSNNYYK